MIPCQLATMSECICSAFQFRVSLAQNKSWNTWKLENEVRKGLKSDDVALNGQFSTISEFICSAFQFRVILAQNKSWNAWKIANEVRKGLKSDDVALNGAY